LSIGFGSRNSKFNANSDEITERKGKEKKVMRWKQTVIVYLLWLFGGFAGLHHMYLGRDLHAFLWATSFGGFIIGWLRDLFRLEEYIDASCSPDEYHKLVDARRKLRPFPNKSLSRLVGSYLFGSYFSLISSCLLPDGSPSIAFALAQKLGAVLGILAVANIGHQTCSWKVVLLTFLAVGAISDYGIWGGIAAAFYTRRVSSAVEIFVRATTQKLKHNLNCSTSSQLKIIPTKPQSPRRNGAAGDGSQPTLDP
jgi:hypothetical protein